VTRHLDVATLGFDLSTRGFDLATLRFDHSTLNFDLATLGFDLATLNFDLATLSFDPSTLNFDASTLGVDLAILVTRLWPLHRRRAYLAAIDDVLRYRQTRFLLRSVTFPVSLPTLHDRRPRSTVACGWLADSPLR
jgi:hypothetical protein